MEHFNQFDKWKTKEAVAIGLECLEATMQRQELELMEKLMFNAYMEGRLDVMRLCREVNNG